MTEYVLSIDCGVSTGIALLSYEPDGLPVLAGAWQFTGGHDALHKWLEEHFVPDGWDYYNDEPDFARFRFMAPVDNRGFFYVSDDMPDYDPDGPRGRVIVEKFNARNTRGFAYTTDSLEALVCEGVIRGHNVPHEWVQPPQQYLVGGEDLADKKKRQHAFLREAGFYRTNKDFPDSPSKDGADDFRSACAHGLAYLARVVKHRPTYTLISEWTQSA